MNRPMSLLTSWSAIAVALVTLLTISSDTAEADFFEPCVIVNLDNPAAGATSNINGSFGVGIGPDCISLTADDNNVMFNVAGTINFTPAEWGVATDADIPNGEKVAELNAEATLGLLNLPCKEKVFPGFEMLDATTDSNNSISPLPPGTADRLAPLSSDANGNGVIDGAEKFPHFLGPISASNPDAIFPAQTLANLRARLFGATTVAGIQIILNFMIFEPGTTLGEDLDFATDPALGYPSVTVLQDPTAPSSNQDAITDFCSPLGTTTVGQGEATPSGIPFRTNPSDGAYNFLTWVPSQFDADGDGIENLLDPCPFDRDDQYGSNNDIVWDPRGDRNQNPGDRDVDPDYGIPSADGIPDSCDPFPDVPSAGTAGIGIARTDEDGDGWANRVDNCPLIANVDQENADEDAIGDACDPNPTVNDGHQHIACLISTVNIGAGGTAPYTNADLICSTNGVGIDRDGNGIFDSSESSPDDSDGDGVLDADDSCPNTPAGETVDEFGCTTVQAQEDDDGDGVINIDDECPDTAAGADVDANGCSASQLAVAAATTGPTGSSGGTGGGVGGPDTGVGSLAPALSSIPAWAAIASGLGLTGLLGSLGAMASRILRRRRQ